MIIKNNFQKDSTNLGEFAQINFQFFYVRRNVKKIVIVEMILSMIEKHCFILNFRTYDFVFIQPRLN